MQVIIYQTNAFTDVPFGGKSAAIIPYANDFSEQDIQDLMRVLKLEKTVFVYRVDSENFKLRFFKGAKEIKFCGSSVIASFFTLGEKGYIDKVENGKVRVCAHTSIESTPIDIYYKDWDIVRVEMIKRSPTLLQRFKNVELISAMLGIESDDIGLEDEYVFPELVYSGDQDLIVPIKSRDMLAKLNFNFEKALEFLREFKLNINEPPKINAFTFSRSGIIESRQFEIQQYSAFEKTCSGMANASMTFFLKRNKLIKNNQTICINGYCEDRPSKVYCEVLDMEADCPIKVGGMGNIFFEGVLSL